MNDPIKMVHRSTHATQIREKGVIDSTGDIKNYVEYPNREIEANEKLLEHQNAYGLTEMDVKSIQENLAVYYEMRKEVQ